MNPKECVPGTAIVVNDDPRIPYNIGILKVGPYLYTDNYGNSRLVVDINWGDGDITTHNRIERLEKFSVREYWNYRRQHALI